MKKETAKRTTKSKIGIALACAALIATLGTGTVFASSTGVFSSPGPTSASLGVKSINVAPFGEGQVMHIIKDRTHFYSVDGGETWNDAIPDGFMLDIKGNLLKIK